MKFIVPSQLLLKNLQTVSGIITTNSAIPIIESVLFQVDGKKLKLTATDLETTMTTELELSDSDGNGQIVVPSKIVLETLKSLPDVPVIFTISEDYGIEMSADEANYKLVGYDSEEFPQKPELENASSWEIDAKILGNAITKTIFATATTDIRPVMTGVLFELKPENTTFVGTDAHRLVRYLRSDIKTGLEASFIVPRKPLLSLKNILQSYEGKVRVDYGDSKVGFTLESLSIVSKLIEGKYPNYSAVIPTSNANVLKVERLPFLQRMRSISPYANQSTHQVRLKMEAATMRLTAENLDVSYRATATVPCNFEGESEAPFEIGFSSKFLQEILTYLDSDEVVMKLSTPSAAGLIFPLVETEDKDEDILMLLMPVMLNEYY